MPLPTIHVTTCMNVLASKLGCVRLINGVDNRQSADVCTWNAQTLNSMLQIICIIEVVYTSSQLRELEIYFSILTVSLGKETLK